jgi:hypothetical protein
MLLMAASGLPLSRLQMAAVLENNVPFFKARTEDEVELAKHRHATKAWVQRHVSKFEEEKGYKLATPKSLFKNRSADVLSVRKDCVRFAESFGEFVADNGDPPASAK